MQLNEALVAQLTSTEPWNFGYVGQASASGSPPRLGDRSNAGVRPLAPPRRASGLPDAAAAPPLDLHHLAAVEEGRPLLGASSEMKYFNFDFNIEEGQHIKILSKSYDKI